MFREARTEFQFNWSHLGDINSGRPNLGTQTHVAAYRLMQYSIRDAIIRHVTPAFADKVFFDAGRSAGKELYANLIHPVADLDEMTAKFQRVLKELGIGILRFEEVDNERLRFTLTMDEDLECAGLPILDEAVCTYDEGFIAGVLEAHTGRPFEAREVDCWATGARTCRFTAQPA